jgi:hypothetical protein
MLSPAPEELPPKQKEWGDRARRIAKALACLSEELPIFFADQPLGFMGLADPLETSPLTVGIDQIMPAFAGFLRHRGFAWWHQLADEIERGLVASYPPSTALRSGNARVFISLVLASAGIHQTPEAIRKRK